MFTSLIDYHKYRRFAVLIAVIEVLMLPMIFAPWRQLSIMLEWVKLEYMYGELAKPTIILGSAYFSARARKSKEHGVLAPIVALPLFVCRMSY